jgi:DNA polymerase IIIc chi subunit
LIGKALAQKKASLVYAPDAEVAAALDRHLWMVPQPASSRMWSQLAAGR